MSNFENEQLEQKKFERVVLEHERKLRALLRNVSRIVLIIAIAVMAVHFDNEKILFWWLVPALCMNGLIENAIVKENEDE